MARQSRQRITKNHSKRCTTCGRALRGKLAVHDDDTGEVIPVCSVCIQLTREEREEYRNAHKRCRCCKRPLRRAIRVYLDKSKRRIKYVCKRCDKLSPQERRRVRKASKKSKGRRPFRSVSPPKKAASARTTGGYSTSLMTPMDKAAHHQEILVALENLNGCEYRVEKVPAKEAPRRGRYVQLKRKRRWRGVNK